MTRTALTMDTIATSSGLPRTNYMRIARPARILRAWLLALVFGLSAFFSNGVQAQCTFSSGFDLDHLPGRLQLGTCTSLEVFNAGDGPKLYGGFFQDSGTSLKAYADGRWTDIPGAPAAIMSLYVWNDGTGNDLYIGTFILAELWKWDGTTFTKLGTFSNAGGGGLAGILTMRMHDFDNTDSQTDLIVGGSFTSVDGVPAGDGAYWDGASWNGFNHADGVIAAVFSTVTGPLAPGEVQAAILGAADGLSTIFSNDPSLTTSLINSLTGQTHALEMFNGLLVRGGDYGLHQSPAPFNVNGTVFALKAWDDGESEKLYVAGDFTSFAGNSAYRGVVVIETDGTFYSLGNGTGVDSIGESIQDIEIFTEAAALGESVYFGGDIEYNDGSALHYDVVRFGCDIQEPTVVDGTWVLTNTLHLSDAVAAHYSAFDDALYVGRRNTTYGPRGLYRLDMDDTLSTIWLNDDIVGVEVDDNGNIYTSDDFSGEVFRVNQGTTTRSVWVSGWHGGDDDPIGLAIAPATASGWFSAGDAFMVDRGSGGPDEVWRWSVNTAQGETVVHADNGTLINALDITISNTELWICDARDAAPGAIHRVLSDGSVPALSLSEAIQTPTGIAYAHNTGDLFVLDSITTGGQARIVRIDPSTGNVTNSIIGFAFEGGSPRAGIDITDDGQRMYVTDAAAGRIYEFTSLVDCPPGDVDGDLITSSSDWIVIRSDYGCDEPVNCDCVGDTNGDCQTDLSDLGLWARNDDLTCPEGSLGTTPNITWSVDVYPTPWPETPPDSGVYYTIDLQVTLNAGDIWTGAQAIANISGNGTYWEHPSGSDVAMEELWGTTPNLEYDSFYNDPPQFGLITPPEMMGTTVNNSQSRSATWFEFPHGDSGGPYTVARYTIRLDNQEAADLLLLTTIPNGTPYWDITGSMISVAGGGTQLPFAATIYSATSCAGDLNGDNITNFSDFDTLANYYGSGPSGDLDGDSDTDRDDLAILLADFNCPNAVTVTGGPVSHSVVEIDNSSALGAAYSTFDLAIDLGDDFWTTGQALVALTEPGYVIYQDIDGDNTSPNSLLFIIFPSLEFDSFFTEPGILVDGFVTIAQTTLVSTSTEYGAVWFKILTPVGQTGAIMRFTIEATAGTPTLQVVPTGTGSPGSTVIGTLVGSSTVASTVTMLHPFTYDIIVVPPQCPADITNSAGNGTDGQVNVFDLLELLANWGTNGTGADIAAPTNIVDVFDLLDLLATWGSCV